MVLDLVVFMVYYLTTMITINVQEAKTHFSRYLDEVEKGEHVIVCKRNRPVAEIRHIVSPTKKTRPIGLAKDEFQVAASFFDEIPDEIVDLFEGRD